MRRAGLILILSVAAAAPVRAGDPDADLLATAGRLAREVSTLRGLSPRGTLDEVVVDPAGARAAAEEVLRRRGTRDDLRARQILLTRLGLLPPGTDLGGARLDALLPDAATFYDPGTHRLFIARWLPAEMQRTALGHELGHALCDRRWPIEPLLVDVKGDGDRRLARRALVEGDATAVQLELADPTGASTAPTALRALAERTIEALDADEAPLWLRETRAFPFVEGLRFVMRTRGRHPWASVDALWRRPPESSEQILHPDKYDAHESPVRVQVTPLDGLITTHRVVAADTLGELGVRVWLEQAGLERQVAERAAAGWGGDRAVAFAPKDPAAGEVVVAWLTTWDSEPDAQEFDDGAARALELMLGAGSGAAAGGGPRFASERRGRMVALVLGAPTDAAGLLGEVFEAWKVGGAGPDRPGRAHARPEPGKPAR